MIWGVHSSAVEHGIADPAVASSILAAPYLNILNFIFVMIICFSSFSFCIINNISFVWGKLKKILKKCAGRESNPGLVRGRDVYYHCTTGARLGVSGFRSQYLVLAKDARFRLRQYPLASRRPCPRPVPRTLPPQPSANRPRMRFPRLYSSVGRACA